MSVPGSPGELVWFATRTIGVARSFVSWFVSRTATDVPSVEDELFRGCGQDAPLLGRLSSLQLTPRSRCWVWISSAVGEDPIGTGKGKKRTRKWSIR